MPERVTKEERQISIMIQKAREAKEMLYQSLMDNNRSPEDDDSEAVKLKRPKAENYNYKAESNDGPDTLHAYAGEITKRHNLKKAIGNYRKDMKNFMWGNMVVSIEKNGDYLLSQMRDFIVGDEPTQRRFIAKLNMAAEDYQRKRKAMGESFYRDDELGNEVTKMVRLLKAILPEDYETNPMLDHEQRMKLIGQIDGLSAMLTGLSKQIKSAKPNEQAEMMDKIVEVNKKLMELEKELSQIPEQTIAYDSEYSGETLDPEYEASR